jgi:hypothetical protein
MPRDRRRGASRRLAAAVAGMAVVVGALWFVGTSVLHDQVLTPGTYLRALDEAGAYRRLYSEVLTDGAVRDVTDRLFDGLAEAGVDRDDAAAVANAALRLALPPAMLRAGAEALVSGVLSYLRGDRATFEAPLAILDALQRSDPAAATLVREAVSAVASLLLDHLEEVASMVRAVADGLADGQIPLTLPLIGGRRVAEEQLMAVLDGLTATVVPAAVRTDALAAIESRDHRDALIDTALNALRSSLQELSDELAAGDDVDVDLVDALVVVSGQDRADVTARAESIRALVARFPSPSRYAGLALFLAGGGGLARLHRRLVSRAAIAVGSAVLVAGSAVWCSVVLVSRAIGTPLADAASAHGRQPFPAAPGRLLGDVDRAIVTSLSGSCTRPALTLVALGAGTAGLGTVTTLWARLSPIARRRVVGTLAVSALAILAVAISVHPDPVRAARVCNGHAELCDRRYDDVVQAATHNSMSSPDVVRVWPEHDGNIRDQLDFGIRTLMLDASYWDGIDVAELSALRDAANPGPITALLDTIVTRLAPRPGTYLCHNLCAFGAISMTTALDQVKAFLEANPNDVVTLMIQDGISPADAEAAFVDSGIDDLLYDDSPDGEWPTLGELIDRGQRLVVFSEQHVPPPRWYLSAFQHIQDTPYGGRSPEELSCAMNRGSPDAPLFLLNNWIERQAPDRAQAAIVNAKDFIVNRARRCAEERGVMPNFIAVSFYGIGNVLGAVDELNGVAAP